MKQPKVELIPLDLNNPDHIGCLFKVRTNPDVAKYLCGAIPKNFLEHTQYLYSLKNKDFFVLQKENNLCGYCQRTHALDEVELGWAIHPDYWGQGVGSASIASLITLSLPYLKPIVLFVRKNNPRALKLYARYEFSIIHETDDQYKMQYIPYEKTT